MMEIGKILVVAGLLIALLGLWMWLGPGRGWPGRLPGDIFYSRGEFTFHFPIVTCLLLSLLLSFLMWLFRK